MVQHPTFGRSGRTRSTGYSNALMTEDAGTPSPLSLPYLGPCEPNDPAYQRTRRFVHNNSDLCFVKGTAGEGVGGPHVGASMAGPLSIITRALTSTDDREIHQCLQWPRNTTDGTGFLQESFNGNDPSKFICKWVTRLGFREVRFEVQGFYLNGEKRGFFD